MATVDRHNDSCIYSSEALSLLDCFTSGFDEVLSNIATDIAKARDSHEVTSADIAEAARTIANAVRDSDLPSNVKREFESMMARLPKKPRR